LCLRGRLTKIVSGDFYLIGPEPLGLGREGRGREGGYLLTVPFHYHCRSSYYLHIYLFGGVPFVGGPGGAHDKRGSKTHEGPERNMVLGSI
jgi:hypothetical protein